MELLPLDCEQCSNAGKMIREICLINKSRVAFSLTTTFDELATPNYNPNHKIVKPEISTRVVLDVDKNSILYMRQTKILMKTPEKMDSILAL